MSSRINGRWKLVAGAGAVLVLLLAALRIAAHREAPPADPGPTPAASAPAATPAAQPHAPAVTEAAPGATVEAAPEAAPEAAADTTPDDPGDLSAAPPLPTRDQVRARPAPAADQDQIIDPQQASLALVERSIERLEAARQAAERAGDAAAARQSRVRIERLRQRRAALQAEIAGAP